MGGLETARELVSFAEYDVEIRIKVKPGTGILAAYIDVTSHRGDQGHIGVDFGSMIRQPTSVPFAEQVVELCPGAARVDLPPHLPEAR